MSIQRSRWHQCITSLPPAIAQLIGLLFLLTLVLLPARQTQAQSVTVTVDGELRQWHRVSLIFDTSITTSESGNPNPFLDYRLDVTFTNGTTSLVVPGHYAADGDAAESSSNDGNIWRAYFMPTLTGTWNYTARMYSGANIAVANSVSGAPLVFETSGSFNVFGSNKAGRDFRGQGLLQYVNGHFLRFAGSGDYYLKTGADSPENFLAYFEFDDTYDLGGMGAGILDTYPGDLKGLHQYPTHGADWNSGDPVWQGNKGKNIIGAVNYLASQGVNSVYMLTYTIDGEPGNLGDGQDIWMWTNENERLRYDVSKLDQWEIVFSHMTANGLMLHIVTQEEENDEVLDNGTLNTVRKLYYRELISRFGHHPALVWNIGEENENTTSQQIAFAQYIRNLDPYDHPITIHSFLNIADTYFDPLLGSPYYNATSIQGQAIQYNDWARELRQDSADAGQPWVIFGDEQGPPYGPVLADMSNVDDIVREAMWGNLMGGGGGVEWYFGYQTSVFGDLQTEDFRLAEPLWQQSRIAVDFFQTYIPFWEMEPDNSLAVSNAWVLAEPGFVYLVFLPDGGTDVRLDLGENNTATYDVRWFDPRSGGGLQLGSIPQISGTGKQMIGAPPAEPGREWAALISSTTPGGFPPPTPNALLEPSNIISDLMPDFRWVAVTAAKSYDLQIRQDSTIIYTQTNNSETIGCDSGICSIDTLISLSGGNYSWRIRASNDFGSSNWSAWDSFNIPVPAITTLVSPQGDQNTDQPTFTWNAVPSATWYYLWVTDMNTGQEVIQQWYRSDAANCEWGTGTCTATPDVPLKRGTHRWWIQAYNDSGYGDWSTYREFNVTTGRPEATPSLDAPISTISDFEPVFLWEAVDGATEYEIWINGPDGSTIYNQTYTADQTNCGSDTTCQIAAPLELLGGSHAWWVRGLNSFGSGPWSDRTDFFVTAPPVADLNTPAASDSLDDNTPTFNWDAVPTSLEYYLWINGPDNQPVIQEWITREQAGCANGTSTCSFTVTTTLPKGTNTWWIQTWNRGGYGPWSSAVSFEITVGPPDVLPVLTSPTGSVNTFDPLFQWNSVSDATEYEIWINGPDGSMIYNQTYTADQTNCGSDTTCQIAAPLELLGGSHAWWVRPINTYGSGPWSARTDFFVTAPPVADLNTPAASDSLDDNTPTFNWDAVPTSLEYYLWINGPDNQPVIQEWITREQAGCANGTGTCSFTVTTTLPKGTNTWWIQTWNRGGYGPWSSTVSFEITVGPPQLAPAPSSPNNTIDTLTPSFIWARVNDAADYQLWINDSSGQTIYEGWHTAAQANCDNDDLCTLSTPISLQANSTYRWWIRARNSYGDGPWSRALNFTIDVPSSDASAAFEIDPSGDLTTASTFVNDSFIVTNTSSSANIVSVSLDLRTAIFPHMVYDPDGLAGDTSGKSFDPNTGATATGYQSFSFSAQTNGIDGDDGYGVVEAVFNDFNPGESFGFSIDIDPNSNKGVAPPGAGESGKVSGLELSGATVIITFSDGTEQTAQVFRSPNSGKSSENIVRSSSMDPPGLQIVGLTASPTTTDEPIQLARVSGPVGAQVRLLVVEGGRFTPPDYNLGPFDANSAVAVTEHSAIIGTDNTVDIPITLTKSGPDSGYNLISAVLVDPTDSMTSPLSPVMVVRYDPSGEGAGPLVIPPAQPAATSTPSPTIAPTETPTIAPTETSTETPTEASTDLPTATPTALPTITPTPTAPPPEATDDPAP